MTSADASGQGILLPRLTDPPNIDTLYSLLNSIISKTVLTFASASARNATLTSPVEGQMAWLQDTNVLTQYTGSAWVNILPGGVWTAYTPTWTATTTSPSPGAGSITGKYIEYGQEVHAMIQVVLGAGFSMGSGIWRWSLPTAMTGTWVGGTLSLSRPVGQDLSGVLMSGATSTTVQAIAPGGAGNWVNTTIPTPANGDTLTLYAAYHKA
ncbi:hypothetical protein J7E97_08250 [Streptomyces sp. ISL-66]|uniref:hypothetical protein n=1 Tax=Streptomyces sp. ISL-66 TaxID=2819186 RepID=UPI001BEC70F4|nr:hypothetical protein [Streptomyces sp. ISL-66]MBT2467865.1 hypothetical protein [Streptomyces sp. ISL-66]